jgi:hypothetical protein
LPSERFVSESLFVSLKNKYLDCFNHNYYATPSFFSKHRVPGALAAEILHRNGPLCVPAVYYPASHSNAETSCYSPPFRPLVADFCCRILTGSWRVRPMASLRTPAGRPPPPQGYRQKHRCRNPALNLRRCKRYFYQAAASGGCSSNLSKCINIS